MSEGILLKAEVLGSEGTAAPPVGMAGVSTGKRRKRRLDWGPDGEGCMEGVGDGEAKRDRSGGRDLRDTLSLGRLSFAS